MTIRKATRVEIQKKKKPRKQRQQRKSDLSAWTRIEEKRIHERVRKFFGYISINAVKRGVPKIVMPIDKIMHWSDLNNY